MSGHSHFKTIKRKKELGDAQKSRLFSKFANELTVASRTGGKDSSANPRLRVVIEKAKEAHMPSENIERAIKRGARELQGSHLEELLMEAYGPGGFAMLIEAITDNKNRTLGEIKQILAQHNAKLVGEGNVRWMFERQGIDRSGSEEPSGSKKWVAKPAMEIQISEQDRQAAERLFEALDENDALQKVYSNLKEPSA